jgi:hypothetical protein
VVGRGDTVAGAVAVVGGATELDGVPAPASVEAGADGGVEGVATVVVVVGMGGA